MNNQSAPVSPLRRSGIADTSAQDRRVDAPPPRLWRRWLAIAAAVLVLVLLVMMISRWASGSRSVSAERLRFAEVTRGTFVRDAAVQGRVVAADSPTLYAPVAGRVTLRVAAGDSVERDQVLIAIDSPELDNELGRERATLDSLEVAVARGRIEADRARLLAQRTADEAEVAVVAARRELERSQRGYDRGAIAEVDYLRAQDTLRTAEIRNRHAAADVDLELKTVAFELQTREAELARQRLVVADLERRINELEVRSPVDGVVGTLSVADRAMVIANTPLATVVDLTRLEAEIVVPENYADDLGIGMPVELRFGQQAVAGTLSAISPEVVDRAVLARVRFNDNQVLPSLRQNQQLQARVLIDERPDVVMVARGPFVDTHGGRIAYVVSDGLAERREISIGATSVRDVEILSGLEPGDRVVIAGADEFGDEPSVFIND